MERALVNLDAVGVDMIKRRGTYTVLIIEDESDIQNFVSRVLELEGYIVFKAGDGNIGLATLREHTIDMVLLDLRLPGPDGWSILRIIKHTPELKKIPVVVITALAEAAQRERTLRMGAAQYLIKPLSAHGLSKTIEDVLHKKAVTRSTKKEYAVSRA
ncbi:MAG: response regulator [Dehalococcoidales bacterium]